MGEKGKTRIRTAPKARMLIKPKQNAANVYQLYIYDEVTDCGSFNWATWEYVESETSADYFREQLADIPDNATIELYINSHGGYVDEGTAIYNQLVRHKAHKIGYVDGVAYSVASLILMACDHIVMGLGTTMLVHNMWTVAAGNAKELRKVADDMDKMMEANRQVYMKRYTGDEQALIDLLEEEKPLTPDECLELGFCDELGEIVQHKELEENPGDDDSKTALKTDELEEKLKQYLTTLFQQQTRTLRAEIRQQADPALEKPEENKCISFLKQFMD